MLDIIQLFLAKNWAALAIWAAAGVLSLALSHRSQIDAWAEKNPRLAGVMKLLRSLGLDPWLAVQAVSLIVRGKLPVKLQAAQIVAAQGVPVSEAVSEEVIVQKVEAQVANATTEPKQ